MQMGGREFFGWTLDRYINVGIFNSVNVNTVASGNWKEGKAPTPPEWPTPKPKSKKKASEQPKSLLDLRSQLMNKKKG